MKGIKEFVNTANIIMQELNAMTFLHCADPKYTYEVTYMIYSKVKTEAPWKRDKNYNLFKQICITYF